MSQTQTVQTDATHTPNKSIFIVSAPRTTSTLLMRIFSNALTLLDGDDQPKELLEPFTQVYYLQPGKTPAPEFSLQEHWPQTPDAAIELINQARHKPMIIKDLAYQCEAFMDDDLIAEILTYCEPLFLIRSPESTALSALSPYAENNALAHFSEEDIGYCALLRLFKRFAAKMAKAPLVIEAEDYLTNPEGTLAKYFHALNLPFTDRTLSLPVTPPEIRERNPAYAVWGDTWYLNAYTTQKLTPKNPSHRKSPYQHLKEDPQTAAILASHLKEQLPAYQEIKVSGRKPM